MPGYDQHILLPPEQEPPRMDADETLPNLLHPSYPYGRPPTLGGKTKIWVPGGRSLMGTVGVLAGESGKNGTGASGSGGLRGWMGGRWAGEDGWGELGLGGLTENGGKKEVPPGMAVSFQPFAFEAFYGRQRALGTWRLLRRQFQQRWRLMTGRKTTTFSPFSRATTTPNPTSALTAFEKPLRATTTV